MECLRPDREWTGGVQGYSVVMSADRWRWLEIRGLGYGECSLVETAVTVVILWQYPPPDALLRWWGRPWPLGAGGSGWFLVKLGQKRGIQHIVPGLQDLPSQSIRYSSRPPRHQSPRSPAPCRLGVPRWSREEEVLQARQILWQRERQAWGVRHGILDGYDTVQGVGDGMWPH